MKSRKAKSKQNDIEKSIYDSKEVTKLNKSDEPELKEEVFGPLDVAELDKPKPQPLG